MRSNTSHLILPAVSLFTDAVAQNIRASAEWVKTTPGLRRSLHQSQRISPFLSATHSPKGFRSRGRNETVTPARERSRTGLTTVRTPHPPIGTKKSVVPLWTTKQLRPDR